MFEIGLLLGVHLLLVAWAFGTWATRPPAVGYFACGALGFWNVSLILTSTRAISETEVSLLGVLTYLAYVVIQGGVLITVGGQIYRALMAYVDRARLGPEAGPSPVELSPSVKTLVLFAAGAGAVAVAYLILSRRVTFVRPGKMWELYVMLGGIAILLGLGCLRYFLERKRVR